MNETTDATSILAPLWRRKWIILAVGVLVGAGTYLYYKRQTPKYLSTTQIYLGAGAEEQATSEKSGRSIAASASNQAALINSIIAEKVRRGFVLRHNHAAAKGKVKAKSNGEKSQFIGISAEATTARASALLANTTAQAYITRQRANHLQAITTAISQARRQLRRLENERVANGASKSKSSSSNSASGVLQVVNLTGKINQLEGQLSVSGAQQVNPAKPGNAQRTGTKPRKNAIFGFVIGLLLASVGAYALGRFDRRLRTLEGIEKVFGAQILTALPPVRSPVVHREGRAAASKNLLEPLRRLHTSLQLGEVMPDQRLEETRQAPRTILFTSPDPGDGKSTIVADLALVQRDAGARVAVIDANFRRPAQARLLAMSAERGLADVLTGALTLADAVQTVPSQRGGSLHASAAAGTAGVATVVDSRGVGSLSLLASGTGVANPPALLAGEAMRGVLRSLAEEYDYVLIDGPSPLEVSDVIPLLPLVDGLVILARAGHTREISAQRLVQVLGRTSSARVLGTAANCVAPSDIERYGFSSSPNGRLWPRRLIGR